MVRVDGACMMMVVATTVLVRMVPDENPVAPVLDFSAAVNGMNHTVHEKLAVSAFAFPAHIPHCLGSYSTAVCAADDDFDANCVHCHESL
jgi:hypothetical protein